MRSVYIWWQDQAEYYFVCSSCYYKESGQQWGGSTRSYGNWRQRAWDEQEYREKFGTKCEWCGKEIPASKSLVDDK